MKRAESAAPKCCRRAWLEDAGPEQESTDNGAESAVLCVVVVMAVIVAVVIVVNTWGRRCDVRGFSPGSIVRSEADFLL